MKMTYLSENVYNVHIITLENNNKLFVNDIVDENNKTDIL